MSSIQLTFDDVFKPDRERLDELIKAATKVYDLAGPILLPFSLDVDLPQTQNNSSSEQTEINVARPALGVSTKPITLGMTEMGDVGLGVRFYHTSASFSWWDEQPTRVALQPLPLGAARYYAGNTYETPIEREIWKRYLCSRMALEVVRSDTSVRESIGFVILDHGLFISRAEVAHYHNMSVGGPFEYYRTTIRQLFEVCREHSISVVGVQASYRDRLVLDLLDDALANEVHDGVEGIADYPSHIFGNDFVFLNAQDPDETTAGPGRRTSRQEGGAGVVFPHGLPQNILVEVEDTGLDYSCKETGTAGSRFGVLYRRLPGSPYVRIECFCGVRDEPNISQTLKVFLSDQVTPADLIPLAVRGAQEEIANER